ncbi:Rap1a/Tai family immunity protein [Ferrovibrio sp.]|uniref:Rap1a/Tai family immunity protein n=1 Tax=Ferrovibrio sp. TaxID=1917215 RepID=UPI003D0D5B64
MLALFILPLTFLLPLAAAAAEPQKPALTPAPNVDERPCRSRDAYCQGYVAGILDSLRIAGSVCLPEAVPAPRVEFIVRDWLALNPSLVSQAGAELIANALRKSFPCK